MQTNILKFQQKNRKYQTDSAWRKSSTQLSICHAVTWQSQYLVGSIFHEITQNKCLSSLGMALTHAELLTFLKTVCDFFKYICTSCCLGFMQDLWQHLPQCVEITNCIICRVSTLAFQTNVSYSKPKRQLPKLAKKQTLESICCDKCHVCVCLYFQSNQAFTCSQILRHPSLYYNEDRLVRVYYLTFNPTLYLNISQLSQACPMYIYNKTEKVVICLVKLITPYQSFGYLPLVEI